MSLFVPQQIRDAIAAHAGFNAPLEACGLLASDGDGLRMAYCLTNVEQSASRFTVDPDEHFRALLHADRLGWWISGVFHSHPRSPAVPSRTDIAAALDPDWIHLIHGEGPSGAELRAWRIADGEAIEIVVSERRAVA